MRKHVVLVVVALLVLTAGAPAATADPVGQISQFLLNAGSKASAIAPGPDGNLWFTDIGDTSAIARVTPLGDVTEFPTGLTQDGLPDKPMGIAAGPDGNMWFTDFSEAKSSIGRITPSGQITTFGLSPFNYPQGIAPGADGNLWFTDHGSIPAIGRITPSGQITEFATGLNANGTPWGIAPGPDGNLWFTDVQGAIGRITPSGQITEVSNGLNAGSRPQEIAVGPDGNLWFTDEGTTNAIGRITPSGQITEFSAGLNGASVPVGIAAGADGNVWFADCGSAPAIGQITKSGQITEFGAGLAWGSCPDGIAPGQDGNLWFGNTGRTVISRVGTGAPAALQTPASVTGAGQPGSAVACQAQWSVWAGYNRFTRLYPFDGYMWLRDGGSIAGESTPTYTPTAADVGHQLACRVTVTYPLPFQLTAIATSPAITIRSALPPPPPSTPVLSALHVSPPTFTLRGHRVGGRCERGRRFGRRHRSCTRRVALTVRFTLSTSATVILTIARALPGRLASGHCAAPSQSDRRHRRCTRLVLLPGTIALPGVAGANAFAFTGTIGGHALGPARYRLIATPRSYGRAGNQQDATFHLAR